MHEINTLIIAMYVRKYFDRENTVLFRINKNSLGI